MNDTTRRSLAAADRILFLCSGNIVRSAFAELYARHLACPLPVSSGGTTYRNLGGVYGDTAKELDRRGVDPASVRAFRARHVDELRSELAPGTVVFGMTRKHLDAVARLHPEPARLHLLTEVLGERDEIADPMFVGGFRKCFRRVADCVEAVVAHLNERAAAPR